MSQCNLTTGVCDLTLYKYITNKYFPYLIIQFNMYNICRQNSIMKKKVSKIFLSASYDYIGISLCNSIIILLGYKYFQIKFLILISASRI